MRPWHRLEVSLLLLLGVSGCAGLGGSKTSLAQKSDGSTPRSSSEWLVARYWSDTTPSSASRPKGDANPGAGLPLPGSVQPQTDIWSAEPTSGLSRYFPKLGLRDSRIQPPSADVGYPTMATRSALLKRPEARDDRQVRTTSAQEPENKQSARLGQVSKQDASRNQPATSLPSDISDLLTGPLPPQSPLKLHERPAPEGDVALQVTLADPVVATEPNSGPPQQQSSSSPPDRPEERQGSAKKTPSDSARPRRDDQLIALTSKDPQVDAAPQPKPPSPTTPSTGPPPPLPNETAPAPVPTQTAEPVPAQAPEPAPAPTQKPAAQPPSSAAEPVPTAEPGGEPVLSPTPRAQGSPPRSAVQPSSPAAANQQSDAGTAHALTPISTPQGKAQTTAAALCGAASGQSGIASAQSGVALGRSAACPEKVWPTVKSTPAPKRRWSLLSWFKSLHHPEPPVPVASSQLPPATFPTAYNRCLPFGEQACLPSPSCVVPQSQSPIPIVAVPCTKCTPRSSNKPWFYWGMLSDCLKRKKSRFNEEGCQGQCPCTCHGRWIQIHLPNRTMYGSVPGVTPSPQASFVPMPVPF